jgi:undecaprenyl-diphosphatase
VNDHFPTLESHPSPVWNLAWLTPRRCRLILLLVLAFGFASHAAYLHLDCPIDLSGDEAQYWDWSRRLDINYYSKGPLVAWIIRGSCAIFGDTMPAVRYPALLLSVCTSIVTYLLTRKLFGSERLALGAVLLFHLVPMFIAGSVLMTIDPPMFFCWALATYFAAAAIFDHKPGFWILAGIVAGIGFLAKYGEMLWFVGILAYLLVHRRRQLGWGIAALVVAALFALPAAYWNHLHDWVSFRHVATQTGASSGAFNPMNVLEMLGSQFGAVGPTVAIMMIGAIVYALSSRRSGADSNRDKLLFLVFAGLPFFLLNLLASIRTKVQANWPAPAYFSLIILTAYFLSICLRDRQTWNRWRGLFWASILIAVAFIPLAHDTAPLLRVAKIFVKNPQRVAKLDLLVRMRGWEELGRNVSDQLMTLGDGAFVMCDDYQQTAETAFYVDHQPMTYCAGPYYGKRLSQYDLWEDRRLDKRSPLIGRNAVYVGKGGGPPREVTEAFERVVAQPHLPVVVEGVEVKSFKTWQCFGFKGMAPLPAHDY